MQSEVFHGTWRPLDVAVRAAYPLLPALRGALAPAAPPQLALRRNGSCRAALGSGAEELVEVEMIGEISLGYQCG